MHFRLNEHVASPAGVRQSRRGAVALMANVLLLAGCASQALSYKQVAADDASKRRTDVLACPAYTGALTGHLAESMLMGLTVGGGPAVIESENAAKRRASKKCMDARPAKQPL